MSLTTMAIDSALAASPGRDWLTGALAAVRADPSALARVSAAAGRRMGRLPLPAIPGWHADEAARALLIAAVAPDDLCAVVPDLYRFGDADEKRAILMALPLPGTPATGFPAESMVTELLLDALRTNDTRLVAAALGPAADRLDQTMWRQGVLKCVFVGVPLDRVHRLDERADAELARMLRGLADERRAAGRDMPADAIALLARLARPEA